MSFELYLQVFEDSEPAGIPLNLIRSALGRYLVEVEEDFWQANFDDGQSCVLPRVED